MILSLREFSDVALDELLLLVAFPERPEVFAQSRLILSDRAVLGLFLLQTAGDDDDFGFDVEDRFERFRGDSDESVGADVDSAVDVASENLETAFTKGAVTDSE